jgi:membrane protein
MAGRAGGGPTGRGHTALIDAALTAGLLALGFSRRTPAQAGGSAAADGVQGYPDDGRGRLADTPSQIPTRGWRDILLRVFRSLSEDRVLTEAAGITFYALLAIFPGIGALVSLYGLFADPMTVERHLNLVEGFVPGGGLEVIRDQLHRVTAEGNARLGFGFLTGLVISLWSANQGTKALFDALNVVYDEKEKRGFIWLNLISLAFTLGGLLFVLLTIAAVVALPVALQFIGLSRGLETLLHLARWPLLLVGIALILALIYRFGPSRSDARWRWVSWGGAVAALVWVAGSAAFSWYVESFGNYNKTYGSLGAVVAFQIWLWLSGIVVLLGAELNAETEHQTAIDSTVGAPKPLGRRGATMADTIGEAQT